MKTLLSACLFFLFSPLLHAGSVELKEGMIIRSSVTVRYNHYNLTASPDLKKPLLVIDGNDITIDFDNAFLAGSNDKNSPDEFEGLAILVAKGSKNIVIKNALVSGYKVAILADSVQNLTISNCNLSYNYRQHLKSNRDREDENDWMSYHKNENNEWLRYGAAIYLTNCSQPVISGNTVTGGQCGLMMTRCDKADVFDNNFSFNSGIGIGLYRSSYNNIHHNRLDYNVRGYSDGKYTRGQNSAGILVFEQSSNNLFAFNTATHSGDGFFLWAGQTTMDTGEGGCNDNFIYGNDFSYAPANGIEITFSRNLVMKNIMKECEHGVWGGYSYDTDISDNTFENNRIGIAIEHGQNMNIALNGFKGDSTGIKLWSREKQPDDWIYAKKRNTESRNFWIAANRFLNMPVAFDVMGTDTVVFSGNWKLSVDQNLILGDRVYNIDTSHEDDFLDMDYVKDDKLKAIKDTLAPASIVPPGRKEIRMTEWGPYDFRYPLIWLKEIDSAGLYHFEILGPKGNWEIANNTGFQIIHKGENIFPSSLVVKADAAVVLKKLQLSYSGPSYTDIFGHIKDSATTRHFEYQAK